jgi:hypothetical protein
VLVSTRRPRRPAAHRWAAGAAVRTTYLADPSPAAVAGAAGVLARAVVAGRARAVLHEARAAAAGDRAPAAGRTPLAPRARARSRARAAARAAGLTLAAARLAALARAGGWRHVHVHSCGDAAQVPARSAGRRTASRCTARSRTTAGTSAAGGAARRSAS